jgi:transposase-like protein
MGAPRKFDEETRARAVRLYQDRMRDHGETKLGARRHVGELLGIAPATLRNWIEAGERAERPRVADVANSGSDGVSDAAELRRLRQEVTELRRANEILKTASAFFAQAELDRRLK